MFLRPAKIHTQEHLGPVLGLGTARARLNVEEGRTAVQLARKHPLKFETGQFLLEAREIGLDFTQRLGVVFLERKIEQFGRIVQTAAQRVQRPDNRFKLRAFLAERLRTLRIVPDVRILELPLDFRQAFCFALVVKGTPLTPQCVRPCPPGSI